MEKEVVMFFATDNGYAPFLAVALKSAVENSSPDRFYRAVVLYSELSEENANKLKALGRENFVIEPAAMQANFQALDDRRGNRIRCEYFTLTIYFRLFIADMFPQYNKAIYLDSDIVLNGDVAKLFDTDIGDNLIGACRDTSIEHIKTFTDYTEIAVGVKKEEYINSGVLLMNLEKMRSCDFQGKFLQLLQDYHFDSVAPDQDYINAMCNGNIYYLDTAWDTMPAPHQTQTAPKLIHYNLFSKPWQYNDIQYEEYFWQYAQESGFLQQILDVKNSFTPQDVLREKQCLNNMLCRAREITESDVTFRKISEKGVKIKAW